MNLYRSNQFLFVILIVISCSSFGDPLDCNDCGGIFKARQFIITTPGYPNDYPPNVCCDYRILSPYRCPTDFHIQLLDFSLEPSLNCKNDVLIIENDPSGDERIDILCGNLTGIKRYKSINGTLRIRFITNNMIQDRGVRLLITRLTCEETPTPDKRKQVDTAENIKNIKVTQPTSQFLPQFQRTQDKLHEIELIKHLKKNVIHYEQHLPPSISPSQQLPLPGYLTPTTNTNSPSLMLSSEYPCTQFKQENNYYPQNNNFLPSGSCCARSFRQQRFYLTSPDFPARTDSSQPRDCFYYIEKSGPNVCFLRVGFRFFSLGSIDPYAGQCLSDFIEIDGERICGCRTGFVYTTQEWGLGVKVIRLKTNGRLSGLASIGFLLDISQVSCGRRYYREVSRNNNIESEILFNENTNSTTKENFLLSERTMNHSADGMNSKLFLDPPNACEFGLTDLLRISFDTLWVTRQRC